MNPVVKNEILPMKNLNNSELLFQTKMAVKNERDKIIIVLRHLKEIEVRRNLGRIKAI